MEVISSSSSRVSLSTRLVQVAGTVLLFALLNKLGNSFLVDGSVSILYPATAVDVVACLVLGWWGALAVFLGTLLTPWTSVTDVQTLAISGLLNVVEGMIPFYAFRWRRGVETDLRDLRSFAWFLLFGATLNSGVSAWLGTRLLVPGSNATQLLAWWISDFSAAVLLAAPTLAFGGALFRRRRGEATRRSIVGTLEITAAIVILGWCASAAIRTWVGDRLEAAETQRRHAYAATSATLTRLDGELIDAIQRRVPGSSPLDPAPLQRILDELAGQPAVRDVQPAFEELRRAASIWIVSTGAESPVVMQRRLVALRELIEENGARESAGFEARRARLHAATIMMDVVVLLILVLASASLIVGISRPLRQMHLALAALSEGKDFNASDFEARFVEVSSMARTIDDTSKALRRREEELRRETERALEASQHKSDFLAKMSHELRTPLNSIVGFSELLMEKKDVLPPDKRNGFIENVWRSGKHLLRLINDLLDLSKVEAGKLEFFFEEIDVMPVVEGAVDSISPLLERTHQRVVVTPPRQTVMVRADSVRLRQIVLNLLANANKFSPPRTTIEVAVGSDESRCFISVRDHGVGITAEDQRRIFDEFVQLELAMKLEGTGLGLALVKHFVAGHGGSIEVESAPGQGSTFRVWIPLAARAPRREEPPAAARDALRADF